MKSIRGYFWYKHLKFFYRFYVLYYKHKIFFPKKSYSCFGEDIFIQKYFKKLVYLALFTAPILLVLYFNNNNGAGIFDNYNFLSTLMNTIYHPQAFTQLIFDGFSDYFYFIPRSLFGFIYDTIGHFDLHTLIFFKIF